LLVSLERGVCVVSNRPGEERHVAARQAAADALVALFKALGGGWPLNEAIPPLRPLQPAFIAAAKYLLKPAQTH
jgi:hypothetical protein